MTVGSEGVWQVVWQVQPVRDTSCASGKQRSGRCVRLGGLIALRKTVVVASTREALRVFRLTGGIEGQPESLDSVTFASVGALELRDIEEWLKKEPTLLGEDLLVVASQLASFDKTRDRPDLLALERLCLLD